MAIEVKKHHFSQIEKCVLHCTVSSVISNSKALGFQKRYITYSQLNGKTLDITVRKEKVQKSIFAFSAILVNIVLLILTMNGNVIQKYFLHPTSVQMHLFQLCAIQRMQIDSSSIPEVSFEGNVDQYGMPPIYETFCTLFYASASC